MKLMGEVTGIFRDVETGEITKTFTSNNHVQNHFLEDLAEAGSLGTAEQIGSLLFISETNPGKQSRDWPVNIPSVRGGSDIAGVDRVTISLNYAPGIHLGQYVQRFSAPAQDYTINIAGLCSTIYLGVEARNADTVVWLETPCVQTTTETLDLYYRVQLLFDDDWTTFASDAFHLNPYDAELLADFLFGNSTSYPLNNGSSIFAWPFSKSNGRLINEPNSSTFGNISVSGTGATVTVEQGKDYFVRRATLARDIQTAVGVLVGWIGTYVAGRAGLISKILPTGISSLQSVFGHRNTSDTPFYNSGNAQLGLGTLTINADSWTDPDFPKYVRLDITTSGLIGAGAYKMRVRNHFGYHDNTFVGRFCPLFFSQENQTHFYNDGWTWANGRTEDTWVVNGGEELDSAAISTVIPYDLDNNKVVVFNSDSMGVVDYITGEGQAVNNLTLVGADLTPRFIPTDLSQCAVASNGDLYFSCRNTGLYKFNAALDTLTIIDSTTTGLTGVTGCKAICIGNAGRLWAYWGHATTPDIYYSDDGGSSWTSAGYSNVFVDANPDLVFCIKADINDAGGKLALLHYNEDESVDGNQIIALKWWDHALTTASDGPSDLRQISRTQHSTSIPFHYGANYHLSEFVSCSPNNSFWAAANAESGQSSSNNVDPGYLTFGTATVQLFPVADAACYMYHVSWEPDSAGNDALIYMTDRQQDFGEGSFGHYTVLWSQDNTYEAKDSSNNGQNFDSRWIVRYLKDGIFLGCYSSNIDSEAYQFHNIYFLADGSPDTALFDDAPGLSNIFYPEYGWNGAAWEKGHAGQRTLHATAEELIDGVTVAWDDTGGTNTFLDSDHYTFGLFDGIWLDGSTEFDWRWDLYAKPATPGSDVEAATLPATTKVSNVLLSDWPTDMVTEWQDEQSVSADVTDSRLVATGTGLQGDYNAGARSIVPAIDGTAQSFLPNATYIPNSDTNNCQGYVQFNIYSNASTHIEEYYGLSVASKLGTTLNYATIDHALHFDSVTPGNGVGTCTVRVVENNVERATLTDVVYNTSDHLRGRIALLTNGSVQYEIYQQAEGAWIVLYTSPPGSVTIQNLYFDCNIVPESGYGLHDVTFNYLDTSNPDYYLYLGDGIDQGVFQPAFQSIDPQSLTVTIDGTESVSVGIDDTVTVLATNTYSLYPHQGVIRYSASDVGKTVSAQYITVHHE